MIYKRVCFPDMFKSVLLYNFNGYTFPLIGEFLPGSSRILVDGLEVTVNSDFLEDSTEEQYIIDSVTRALDD